MSISKNVFRLNKVYELVNAGLIDYSGSAEEPGSLWTWGSNSYGRIGNNSTSGTNSPVQIPGSWLSAFGSRSSTAGIKSDNTFWLWGHNNFGQLGQNDTINRSSPIQLPGTQWCFYAATTNSYASAAIKTDGTLWTWGCNYRGLGGRNTAEVPSSSPAQIPGTQWVESHFQQTAGFGRKTDGTLWAWGNSGSTGYFGNNLVNACRSSPIQIPGTQWNSICSYSGVILATKSDGTFWSWGYGGDRVANRPLSTCPFRQSSATQIPGTQWTTNFGQALATFGIKNDSTLWGSGKGNYGQIGDNTSISRSSPVQIPGTQWAQIHGFSYALAARKNDNTLWSWGYAGGGRLGLGVTTHRSSPTQIPGSWLRLERSSSYPLAKKSGS